MPSEVTPAAVDGSRSERVGGDEVAAALLGHADEPLLAGLVVRVAEGRLVVLEGAHLLELLLHPAAALDGELEDLGQVLLRDLAVRVENLHQTRDGLAHRLAVAGVQVRAQREVPIDDLGEVVLPQLAERLGQVVDHEAVVVREELVPHLRDLPAREVEVHAVDEGHVVADDVRHRREEVAGLDHDVDRLVRVAEHGDARVAGDRLLPALEGAGLAVGLHRRDDLLRHLLEVGHLVEADDVPDLHHALLATVHVAEEVGHRRRPVSSAEYGETSWTT